MRKDRGGSHKCSAQARTGAALVHRLRVSPSWLVEDRGAAFAMPQILPKVKYVLGHLVSRVTSVANQNGPLASRVSPPAHRRARGLPSPTRARPPSRKRLAVIACPHPRARRRLSSRCRATSPTQSSTFRSRPTKMWAHTSSTRAVGDIVRAARARRASSGRALPPHSSPSPLCRAAPRAGAAGAVAPLSKRKAHVVVEIPREGRHPAHFEHVRAVTRGSPRELL